MPEVRWRQNGALDVNPQKDNASNALTDDLKVGPGSQIDGRYELVERLGTGGFGTVFKARHLQLDRPVAVKVLHPRLIEDPEAVKRFQQEAQAVSLLDHPHIIRVFSFGLAEGLPYMATELLSGTNLFDFTHNNILLQPVTAIPIFLQICQALRHAHERGIIHRDLKPSNVMLIEQEGDKEFAKVLDFGFAKISPDAGINMQNLTQTGTVVGDPLYMSPEQCRAQPLDARSDIYSMGCLMYEALSGAPPFQGDNAVGTMFKRLVDEPEPFAAKNKAITAGLEDIVLRALEREPDARFQTARDLGEALEKELQAIDQGTAKRASVKPKRRPRSQTLYRIGMASAVGLCLLAAGGIIYQVNGGRFGSDTESGVGERLDISTANSTALRAQSAEMLRLGEFEEAHSMAGEAVQRARRDNRQDSMLAAVDQLYHTNASLGKLSECLANAKESVERRRHMFGKGTVAEAIALGKLGQTEFALGDFTEAAKNLEVLANHSLAFEALLPLERLTVLDHLAAIYITQRKADDAERVLRRYEQLVKGYSELPAETQIMASLLRARLKFVQERYPEALKILRDALQFAEKKDVDSYVRKKLLDHMSAMASGYDRPLSDQLHIQSEKVNINQGQIAYYFPGAEGRCAMANAGYRPATEALHRQLYVYDRRPDFLEPSAELNFIDYIGCLQHMHKEGEVGAAVSWYRQIVKRRPPTT